MSATASPSSTARFSASRLVNAAMMAVLVSVASVLAWRPLVPELHPPSATISGAAYQPYKDHAGPHGGQEPTREEVEADMAALARNGVQRVRTYSALGAAAFVPEAAARYGMTVLQGVWIGRDPDRRRAEIEAAVELARLPNVTGLITGSEALFRRDATLDELALALAEVRLRTGKPVGIAELWGTYIELPRLGQIVDFGVIHLLPYWDNIRPSEALPWAQTTIERVQATLQGKPLIIGETGWPSRGSPNWLAPPSLANEASYLRSYFDWANRVGITSFAMEAFDGPWKNLIEGSPGPHWGFLDADRQLKFPLSGPIETRRHWRIGAAASALVGLTAILASLAFTRWSMRGMAIAATAATLATSGLAWSMIEASSRYYPTAELVAWTISGLLFLLLILLVAAEGIETTAVLDTPDRRPPAPYLLRDRPDLPVVSVHIPTHAEPPQVVVATIEALARLHWPRDKLEVVVLDNNTKDEALFRPVEEACGRLNATTGSPIFKFHHLMGVQGFKAGALDEALARTRQDATIVAVIDADYTVDPSWLRAAVAPLLEDPDCAYVQAPQDHRDREDSPFKAMIASEYETFFHAGMVERARDHAHILHGTMVVLRRSALEQVGGWQAQTICEDAELGLRLQATGWRCSYIRQSLGWGLLPDDMASLQQQRQRWAYGGARILIEHAHLVFGRGSSLSWRQRARWIAGWTPWAGEALSVVLAALSIAWTAAFLIDPKGAIQIPEPAQYLPAIALVPIKVLLSWMVIRARVPSSPANAARALITGLALAPTHGLAFLRGLLVPGLPFKRTPKAAGASDFAKNMRSVRFEGAVAALLLGLAILTYWQHPWGPWYALWSTALVLQSLPYASAIVLVLAAGWRGRGKQLPTQAYSSLPAGHQAA